MKSPRRAKPHASSGLGLLGAWRLVELLLTNHGHNFGFLSARDVETLADVSDGSETLRIDWSSSVAKSHFPPRYISVSNLPNKHVLASTVWLQQPAALAKSHVVWVPSARMYVQVRLLDVGAPLVVCHFIVAFLLDLWVLLEDVRHGGLKGRNGNRPNVAERRGNKRLGVLARTMQTTLPYCHRPTM